MGFALVPGLVELLRDHTSALGGVLFFSALIPAAVVLWKASEEWKR